MGDDHQAAGGRVPPAGQAGKPRLRLLPVVFLVLMLLALGLGFLFKHQAAPTAESQALTSAPQTVGVYVSQTGVTVHLTAGIRWDPSRPGQAQEALYAAVEGANVSQAAKLLFTSTIRPSDSDLAQPSAVYLGGNLVRGSPEYAWSLTVAQLNSVSGLYGSPVADFTLPQVAQVSGGSVFVHLPALASDVSPFPSIAIEMTEQATSSPAAPIRDVVTSPALVDQAEAGSASYTSHTGNYVGEAAGSSRELYYQPQTLMTTETINSLRPYLQNAVIDSNLPGNGTLQGDTYVWQATGWLEGYLSATEVRTSSAEANHDFYAGLAFGTAAAFFVACAQEFKEPTTTSPRRRGRRAESRPPR